ncbi:MAG: hypothetical protein ACI4PC_07295 [Oscillospiraceae bacterium]
MELKLYQGNYVPRTAGGLETVRGSDEAVQRVLMKLAARRGSFYPLPDYGSRLHTLCRLKPSERAAAARQFVAEALTGETELSVLALEYRPTGDDEAEIELTLGFPEGEESRITLKV